MAYAAFFAATCCTRYSFKSNDTATLHRQRVVGIEPTWLAWKARTLPLSYTREKMDFQRGDIIAIKRKSQKSNVKMTDQISNI